MMNTMHGRDRNVYIEYRRFLRDSRKYDNSDASWTLHRHPAGSIAAAGRWPSAATLETQTRRNLVLRAQRTAEKAGRKIFIVPPTPESFHATTGSVRPIPDFDVGRKYTIERKRTFQRLRVTAPQAFKRQDDKEAAHIAHWSAVSGLPGQRVEELQKRWFGPAAAIGTRVTQDLKFVFRITQACRIPKEAKGLIEGMFDFCVRMANSADRQQRIDFDAIIRILGVFQRASIWRPNQQTLDPDTEHLTVAKYQRDQIARGKLYSNLKARMIEFFFNVDTKTLIIAEDRAKLSFIEEMIASLESGRQEEEAVEESYEVPTRDGAAVAGVMMGFLRAAAGNKDSNKPAADSAETALTRAVSNMSEAEARGEARRAAKASLG